MKVIQIVFCFLFFANQTFSQKQVSFVSTGVSYNTTQDLSYSLEVGKWGKASIFSYSLVVDLSKNVKYSSDYTSFIGAKTYITIADKENVCFMLFLTPKIQLNDTDMFIIEEGANVNYTLNKSLLFGYSLGVQHSKINSLSPYFSLSLVKLFNK